MKKHNEFVQLAKLTRTHNHRVIEDGTTLIPSMIESGLLQRLLVHKVNDKYVILQGHLRYNALCTLNDTDSESFDKWFSKGIPCEVVTEATVEEIAKARVDQGLQRGLTNPMERQMAFEELFDAGMTESACAVHMSTLLDSQGKAIPADRMKKLALLKRTSPAKYAAEYLEVRRGLVQSAKRVWLCPRLVFWSFWLKNVGDDGIPEAIDQDDLIANITNEDVEQILLPAINADIKDSEKAVIKFSKDFAGPKFLKAWEDLKEEKDKKILDKAQGKKIKSKKDLENLLHESSSTAFKDAIKEILGEPSVRGKLREADLLLHYMAVMEEHRPDEYKAFIARAVTVQEEVKTKIQAEIKASMNGSSPAIVEPEVPTVEIPVTA